MVTSIARAIWQHGRKRQQQKATPWAPIATITVAVDNTKKRGKGAAR